MENNTILNVGTLKGTFKVIGEPKHTNQKQQMAASRQVYTSMPRGSEDVISHICVPCFSDDQHEEAKAFCVECEEYLCNTCLQCHKKNKASKHHQLLIGEDMDKHVPVQTAKVVFEKCATHTDEVIKFYCNQHDVLGCSDCITLNHRTCDLEYLPDKCADIDQEYAAIMEKLEEKLKDAKDVMKNAEDKDKRIDESYNAVWKKIYKLRHEIEKNLDDIQNETETNAYNMRLKNKINVQDAVTSCVKLTSNMEKLEGSLKENKTRREFGELYINMRKAKSTLESEEIQRAEKSLQCTNTHFVMECYEDFPKVFLAQSFGDLKEQSADVETLSLKTEGNLNSLKYEKRDVKEHSTDVEPPALETEDNLNWLKYKGNLYVRTVSDDNVCDIIACAVLSPLKLVLADWNNSKIKLVDLSTNAVIGEIFTGGQPYDVAVLPEGRIAVTVPFDNRVIFIHTAEELEIYNSIPLQTECRGITYKKNSLYIVCLHPNRITVLDANGLYKHTIRLAFDSLDRITTSLDHKFLYLTNFCEYPYKNEVVRVTKSGKVSKVYRNKQVHGPVGMVVLDDDSLLVCSINNKTIHHIESDFKNGRMINDRVYNPTGISYNRITGDVYVCQSKSNKLKIFNIR